jgi:LacI family transcriptional regulator
VTDPVRPPTLHDVARVAGFSVSTTARALGDYGRIAPATREAVRAAAAELGYRRNSLARSMITGRTETIGVVCADMGSPFFAEALRGISDRAKSLGFSILIVNTDEDLAAEVDAIALLREKQVDGLIVAPADVQHVDHLTAFQREGRPVVLLDRSSAAIEADSVAVDDVAATESAVNHLIDRGHTRIGIVTELRVEREADWATLLFPLDEVDRRTLNPSSRRLLGYLRAHAARGVAVEPRLVARTGATSVESAREATLTLLHHDEPPTAIITVDNSTSVGAYGAVRSLGVLVPQDVSFVAFDNLDWTTLVTPALTVVEQPVHELGVKAADLLVGRISGTDTTPVTDHMLQTRLIERHSTRTAD